MARSNRILITTASLIVLVMFLPDARAWSNGGYSADVDNPDYGTHDWIADEALTIQTRDVTFLRVTYRSQYLLGTEAPDNPDYIGDTAKHHVYYATGHLLVDNASATRASQIYSLAKGYIDIGDYRNAAYDIGVMTHYISDPGVFGHTMGVGTDWGAEIHHSDYETHVNSTIGSLSFPAGTTLNDDDAYTATIRLAENTTFGDGDIRSNVWMDGHYNWTDTAFESSAKASLYRSIEAVAAVINHLMIAAASPLAPPQAPEAPISLVASVEDSHVVITWSPPPNDGGASITGYKIYRGATPNTPSYLTSVPADICRWTDESVEGGKTYYYWVAAENSAGSSDMSQVSQAILPKEKTSLVIPLVFSAISVALASGGIIVWRRRKRSS